MKFSEFIVDSAIVPALQSTDRDGVLRELVQSLCDAGALSTEASGEVVEALINREKNGSTGFGKGVAVPHVKHHAVTKMIGTIGRSVAGVEFSALDNQPVYTVVLLLSPADQHKHHLDAMNIIFSSLQRDTFRRFLKQSPTRESISELLGDADQAAK